MDLAAPPEMRGSCLDVMGMLRWRKAIWGDKLILRWHRGHPEKQDPSGKSWSKVDWLNYAADAVAESEYGKDGGIHLQKLLFKTRKFSLHANGTRLEDVHNNTIQNILATRELGDLCDLYNMNVNKICWRLTEVAAGNVRSMQNRAKGLRYKWEINGTNGRHAELGLFPGEERIGRYAGESFEDAAQGIISARCRFCFRSKTETMDHILSSCPHYRDIRRKWHADEIIAIRDIEPKFEDTFKETVHITAEGTLISRTNECHIHNTLKAFIPVKWAQPRISDGEAVSEEYIRDYGKRLRNTLWKNTWNKRQDSFREWQEEIPNNYQRQYGVT